MQSRREGSRPSGLLVPGTCPEPHNPRPDFQGVGGHLAIPGQTLGGCGGGCPTSQNDLQAHSLTFRQETPRVVGLRHPGAAT